MRKSKKKPSKSSKKENKKKIKEIKGFIEEGREALRILEETPLEAKLQDVWLEQNDNENDKVKKGTRYRFFIIDNICSSDNNFEVDTNKDRLYSSLDDAVADIRENNAPGAIWEISAVKRKKFEMVLEDVEKGDRK